MYYLDHLWESPDLVCHYLMRVCCEIRRVLSKNPNAIQDDQFKIKFVDKSQPDSNQLSESEIAKQTMLAKSRWFGIAGLLGGTKKS